MKKGLKQVGKWVLVSAVVLLVLSIVMPQCGKPPKSWWRERRIEQLRVWRDAVAGYMQEVGERPTSLHAVYMHCTSPERRMAYPGRLYLVVSAGIASEFEPTSEELEKAESSTEGFGEVCEYKLYQGADGWFVVETGPFYILERVPWAMDQEGRVFALESRD